MESFLGSPLRNSRFSVLEQIWKERMEKLEIENALVYMFDTVPEAVLPELARQFDVLGYKGWDFTSTTEERRQLLKDAVELHRRKGTPYAMRRAFRAVGYYDIQIIEGGGVRYDGSVAHDGSVDHGASQWAVFSIVIDLGENKGLQFDTGDLLAKLVEEYKPARCTLLDVNFRKSVETEVDVEEDFFVDVNRPNDSEDILQEIRYDGTFSYNGLIQHNGERDVLSLSVQVADEPETFLFEDLEMSITITNVNGTVTVVNER